MKHILQLSKYYAPYRGGIELVAKMISKAHTNNGDKVSVLSFGDSNKKYKEEFQEQVIQKKSNFKLISAPINFFLLFTFIPFLVKHKPDLIYVHLPNPMMHLLISLAYRIIKLFHYNPQIHAIYHSDIINQKLLAPYYNWYFRHTSKCYDRIIVACDKIWTNSPVLTRLPHNKMKIVHYCSDLSLTFVERKIFKRNLVAIGRCVPYKGFDFLIKTLNNTSYQLTIIGDGPELPKLQNLAASNIKLVGYVSETEKEQIINQSDLLIVSSINNSEAYGMITVEAFSNGLPVIASDVPSCVTFLAKDGERSLNFKPLNSQQLLACLEQFNNNDKLLNKFSKNAYKFYKHNLSFSAFSANLLKD